MKTLLLSSDIINPTKPDNYEDEPEFFADGLAYHSNNTFRYELKNTILRGTCAIYTPLKFLKASALRPTWENKYSNYYYPLRIAKDIIARRLRFLPKKEKYITLFDAFTSNHYHFIVDLLPRLTLLEDNELNNLVLVLPDSSYCKKNADALLNLFNIKLKGIHYIKKTAVNAIPNLIFISKPVDSGFSHPGLIRKLQKKLNLESRNVKYLYVTRRSASFRKVLNEEQVVKALTNIGFEVIDFNDYTVDQQARICSGVHVMVGMHGAGLTNCIFMKPGGRLIEFRRTGPHDNHCYWHLSSSVGLKYSVVMGEPDNPDLILEGNYGCNLHIDIDKLLKIINFESDKADSLV